MSVMRRLGALGAGFGVAGGLMWMRAKSDKPSDFSSGLGLGSLYYQLGDYIRGVVDGETAHVLGVQGLSQSLPVRRFLGLVDTYPDPKILNCKVFGLNFPNPLGMAAGFDKNGECIDGVHDMGFGFAELGSVTPLPQPGNPLPRVFRLKEDRCVINRYGFNSQGLEVVRARLLARQEHGPDSYKKGVVGVNLGKNKLQEDATVDYVKGVQMLGEFADYLVVNVSSPNTPGLRSLQGREQLLNLLAEVKQARDDLPRRVPLLVKIAPDLTSDDKDDIAAVVLNVGVDGMIISNTTIARPESLRSPNKDEAGGLSGPILMEPSTQLIKDMYRLTDGTIPIIGVGGVSSGHDAYRKIRAGASLVQLYTSFTYDGPAVAANIKEELTRLLLSDGFSSVEEAIGVDVPGVPSGAKI